MHASKPSGGGGGGANRRGRQGGARILVPRETAYEEWLSRPKTVLLNDGTFTGPADDPWP